MKQVTIGTNNFLDSGTIVFYLSRCALLKTGQWSIQYTASKPLFLHQR